MLELQHDHSTLQQNQRYPSIHTLSKQCMAAGKQVTVFYFTADVGGGIRVMSHGQKEKVGAVVGDQPRDHPE
jgi:hypothetical protein